MVVHLLVLLSCTIQVAAQMKLSPKTLTVLRGEEARFTCSPPDNQWTVMVWLLNGAVALTISKLHGVLASTNASVTAEIITPSKVESWVFVLRSTERHYQGEVTCDLQGFERKTASLFVQEKGSVKVLGDDKLAFKGQSVVFECQAEGWYPEPILQWQVNDMKVSLGEYNISSEESGKSLFTVSSNLSVTATKSSDVECLASVSALPTPLNSRVRLTVVAEVVQEEDDCTVLLAVTATLSALLLLLLLCICIVLCYRQRKQAKSAPQETMWFDQSAVARRSPAEVATGRVNLGYFTEGPNDTDDNELNMETRSQMDFVSPHKVPDVLDCGSLPLSLQQAVHSENQTQAGLSLKSFTNIRRITTV
ncbi:immunoglobulin superfamily member 5-like isoform X1 [Echeneis naucrates]|uniref:immunoglobulin superfamily member 5-like isoform X1 n=1 Tax=Echeneis naucrates TaxID=173247 RepID=UPI001113E271|nr:immunoglobulin superfamily member 5-like isoform X1 [Echeneis naucrates]XP_029373928.1 immunoglobulin superfamily member 5-like isoform X1 [Echeneis naucrates]